MTDIEWGRDKEALFWSKVDQSAGPDKCWPWTGTMRGRPNRDGVRYGGFMGMNASRFVAALKEGRPLNGLKEYACHSCDNPVCCNPAHISVGSPTPNQLESVERGRHSHATKTHCRHGHPYAGENLFVRKNGMRECRTCMRASVKRSRANG